MKWNILKVQKALGDKVIGTVSMKEIVYKTILTLPSEFIEKVCTTIWFISSPEDAWAFTFKGEELKKRSLIFLSDELLRQDEEQISYTLLHEIGHVVLHHRNSIGYQQTQTEINRQEREADQFARQYSKS